MGIIVGRPHLKEVSADVGGKEIKTCKLIPEKDWEEEKRKAKELSGEDDEY